jgi:peptidoglycan/LPS O-acetylase OafA/YrhL
MRRIVALDSIRGIAALVVVFYHCSLAAPQLHDRIAATYVLRPFVAGPAAVYLFFVLSGFVLYGVLAPGSAPPYPNYAAKRVLRLWLPAAAVVGSALLYVAVDPSRVPGASDWFSDNSWIEAPSPAAMAYHFALFSAERYHQLDNAIWTLAHEIKISLIFPSCPWWHAGQSRRSQGRRCFRR